MRQLRTTPFLLFLKDVDDLRSVSSAESVFYDWCRTCVCVMWWIDMHWWIRKEIVSKISFRCWGYWNWNARKRSYLVLKTDHNSFSWHNFQKSLEHLEHPSISFLKLLENMKKVDKFISYELTENERNQHVFLRWNPTKRSGELGTTRTSVYRLMKAVGKYEECWLFRMNWQNERKRHIEVYSILLCDLKVNLYFALEPFLRTRNGYILTTA